MNKEKIALILGVVCLVLTYGICIQMNTIKKATQDVGSSITDNSDLKDEYLRWQSNYKNVYSQLEQAEEGLEAIRQKVKTNNSDDEQSKIEIDENNDYLGLTELKGKGIIIKLDDNRNISGEDVLNPSDYLVHEGDLLQIVNELFNAGADAVSINNQRVTLNTSILCDGNIIRVNGEMVGVPITIKAIGYPERLQYALTRPLGYLEVLSNDGVIVEAKESDDITIPKYEGVYAHEYITRGDA